MVIQFAEELCGSKKYKKAKRSKGIIAIKLLINFLLDYIYTVSDYT